MQEPHEQGVANRFDLESCADPRKGMGEALTEGIPGQPLSSEIISLRVPTSSCQGEGHTKRSVQREFRFDATESETLSMEGHLPHENRETPSTSLVPERRDRDRLAKAHRRKADTHLLGESDELVVPEKRTNNAGVPPAAESVEERSSTKGNDPQTTLDRTQRRKPRSLGLWGVREAARRDQKMRFTALLHHITPELLRVSFFDLKRQAAPGIDGRTWQEYACKLERRIDDLHHRVHRGTYRAQPSKRVWIPKPDGRQRPLGLAAVEDKLVQQAVKTVLECVYEADFLGFSYGFRPRRGCHDALDALVVGLERKRVNWVLDADIRGFFDALDHAWLLKFLQHRIADPRLLRLLQKWLRAGVSADGQWLPTKVGTPQGAVISPLLANVFLHCVLDLWIVAWRNQSARGHVIVVRYADDFVMGFESRADARACLAELRARFQHFGLALHPDKTRLIEFGRFAAERRAARGEGKPETFTFLGFTHHCAKTRGGAFTIRRKSNAKKIRAKLQEIKTRLSRCLHAKVRDTGRWLRSIVQGWLNYHAVPGNFPSLNQFLEAVEDLWRRALRRRSQRGRRWNWSRHRALCRRWLPRPHILHPYPAQRFNVTHPR
jgi:RNA-directed DNA polymerase